jgi:acyl carrier protein
MSEQLQSADEIKEAVRAFMAKITERDPTEISDTHNFEKDLDIDSLMAMEIMVSVNKKYRIEILDEEFGTIRNLDDAVKVVQRHLAARAQKTS